MLPTSDMTTSMQNQDQGSSSHTSLVERAADGAKYITKKAGGVVCAYGCWSVAVVHNGAILTAFAGLVGLNPALLPFFAAKAVPIIGTAAFGAGYFGGEALTGATIDATVYVAGTAVEATTSVASVVFNAASERLSGRRNVPLLMIESSSESESLIDNSKNKTE